jgi:hypothetical protein
MAIRVFFSYSHEDEAYRDQLDKHLTLLRRQRLIDIWHDRRILPGQNFAGAIDKALDEADVILLLVSASFLASEYCYSVEMGRALERNRRGEVAVIPVIVRPCDWRSAPFGELLAAPRDGKPLTQWLDIDAAYTDVAAAVRRAVEARAARTGNTASPLRTVKGAVPPDTAAAGGEPTPRSELPRTPRPGVRAVPVAERARFLRNAHAQLARHFERSLADLQTRDAPMSAEFIRIDAKTFVCRATRAGQRSAECAVCLVPDRDWIAFSDVASSRGDIYSECLCVGVDECGLFLRCLGLNYGAGQTKKLNPDEAATLLWNRFLDPLQM